MRPDFVLAGVLRTLVVALAWFAVAACGASSGRAREPGAPAAASAKGAGEGARGDGGAAGGAPAGGAPAGGAAAGGAPAGGAAADAGPPSKPFAGSPTEAMQLIGAALDKNAPEVKKCVAEYRTRKKLPHERVEISVGIDQEGRLLGATLKSRKPDAPFAECAQKALASAAFPRSHAGVIQMTKSYEEIEQ